MLKSEKIKRIYIFLSTIPGVLLLCFLIPIRIRKLGSLEFGFKFVFLSVIFIILFMAIAYPCLMIFDLFKYHKNLHNEKVAAVKKIINNDELTKVKCNFSLSEVKEATILDAIVRYYDPDFYAKFDDNNNVTIVVEDQDIPIFETTVSVEFFLEKFK
ncbi:MAG: hypothetical protein J6M60_00650 [Clostridia bacterium]|nr:hypothetical protein [Clostridia bacterium]